MSTKHPYQIMPKPSPEDRAALTASIAADGVRVPIDIDDEGNILDGHQRQEISDELGLECPKRVITGLTEAQKLDHAWQVNVARRHLSKAQKRQLAAKLWRDEWTQERIAQVLGVSQSTVANWVGEFIKSGKLPASSTTQGKDGKQYPRTKMRRRTAQPPKEANGGETPLESSDAGDRSAQGPEQRKAPPPRGTGAKGPSPGPKSPGAPDLPGAPEAPPLATDEVRGVAGGQPNSAPESSALQSTEDAAEAGWVGALEDFSAKLETLQRQGRLLPPHTRWASDTRARGLATIRRIQGICSDLAAVVGADMSETAARNGHDDADATPPPVLVPIADEAQEHGNGELVTRSSAEEPGEDVADGDHLPLQCDGEGKPPAAPSRPARAEDREDSPGRTRTRRAKQAVANGQGSGVPGQTAQDHPTPDDSQSTREAATMGHPAPQHDEDALDPAADAERPSGVPLPSETADAASGDVTRCGWCGGSQFLAMSQELGHIFCECRSVYNPSTGEWSPGIQAKRHTPPAPLPATAA